MEQYYNSQLQEAILLNRINRFVARVEISGQLEEVYVPNTGRLSELAIPGAKVLLSGLKNSKFRYKILYIIKDGFPVMIDSSYSNRLFYDLLIQNKVPFFRDIEFIKREPSFGNHRFDFFIKTRGDEYTLELKSCTLFYNDVASFPDAVSERAASHIESLSGIDNSMLIFFVLNSNSNIFIPNYHRDYKFYKTLVKYRDCIRAKAFSINYLQDLSINSLQEIPVFLPDVSTKGIFILLFSSKEIKKQEESFFIFIGSSEDVFKSINNSRKKISAISSNLNELRFIMDIPVISEAIDVDLVSKLLEQNFHCKRSYMEDFLCLSLRDNPSLSYKFWDIVLYLWFGDFSAVKLL